MSDRMVDPERTGRRKRVRRQTGRTAGRGDRERKPREALAREPDPARGHVTEPVTPAGGNDSTHILDR